MQAAEEAISAGVEVHSVTVEAIERLRAQQSELEREIRRLQWSQSAVSSSRPLSLSGSPASGDPHAPEEEARPKSLRSAESELPAIPASEHAAWKWLRHDADCKFGLIEADRILLVRVSGWRDIESAEGRLGKVEDGRFAGFLMGTRSTDPQRGIQAIPMTIVRSPNHRWEVTSTMIRRLANGQQRLWFTEVLTREVLR
jgi:hypothetical protein